MNYQNRFMGKTLLDWIKKSKPPFNCLLLSGARQCGKTTLLHHLFPPKEHIHINLAREAGFGEDIEKTKSFDDFTFLIESRFRYKMGSGKILIIDEAQLAPRLASYVRFFKEDWKNQHVILTGSTLSTLFDHEEKPTGRVTEFVLRPFNFLEFLQATGKEALYDRILHWKPEKPFSETIHQEALSSLEDYLKVGGLPEVVFHFKEGRDYLKTLADIYGFYKRDFENQFDSNLTPLFHKCFQRIAAATGSPITNASIIQSSSPGYRKVREVLATLEMWSLILKIDAETSSLSQVSTLTPKRYLFDHGIRFLQNPGRFNDFRLNETQNLRREELGGVLENFALTEYLSTNPTIFPKSWSKSNQAGNVDFLLFHGGKNIGLEVKAATHLNSKHLTSLYALGHFIPKAKLILTNLDQGGFYDKKKNILNLPLYALFSFFEKDFNSH